MWYEDLSPCDYFPIDSQMTAVGWLERGKPYATGAIDKSVYLKFVELLKNPWQFAIAGGVHKCDLCQFDAEARGGANLFVPYRGVIYASPALITHYINAHHYLPPNVFCDAILACPPMRSLEYLKALRDAGGKAFARLLKPNSPISDPGV